MSRSTTPLLPNQREVENPFILTALVCLLTGSLWLWARHSLLLEYFYSTEMLALTHLMTLGFVTSLMMGVLLKMAPMSLGIEARSPRLVRIQFWLFAVGASGMVFHFWISEWVGMAWATLLVLAAAIVQLFNFSPVFTRAAGGDWVARYVASSMVYLVLAATLGGLLGFNKALELESGLLGGVFITNLFAHIHLAAVGWVTTMIFGFQLKLVPSTRGEERFLPVRFLLLQLGTLGLVGSLLADASWEAPFAALLVVAVLWQAWGPTRALVTGRAREWEVIPLWFLSATAITGMLLALGLPAPDDPLRLQVQFAYGYAGLVGWIVLTIVIVAFKLFPTWVWQKRFLSELGVKPVPAMKDLYNHRLRIVSNLLVTIGVVGTVAGILGQVRILVAIAPGLVFAGLLGFAFNFFRLARWAHGAEYDPSPEDLDKFQRIYGKTGQGGFSV